MSGPPPGFNSNDSLLPDPGPSAAPIHVMRGGGGEAQATSEEDKNLLEKYGMGPEGILKGKIDEKVKAEFLKQLKSGKCSVGTGDMVILKKDCWAVSMVIRELLKAGIQRTNKLSLGFKPKPKDDDNQSQTEEERDAENAETPESLTITIEDSESTKPVSELVEAGSEESAPVEAPKEEPSAEPAPTEAPAEEPKAPAEPAPAEPTTNQPKKNNKKQGGLRHTKKKKRVVYKTRKETRQRSKSRYARRTRRNYHN
jgi:hypothetical protein